MKWKATLILLIVTGGVFAYLFLVERNALNTADAAHEAQNVVNFSREKVNGITIQNGDDKIDIRRHDDKWRLETPIRDQADATAVNGLLLDLENWQKEATISAKEMEADKSKLADYGLAQPKVRLKLSGEKVPPEIWFGKEAALEGKMYVRFANSKETFLVNQSVKKAIDKKPEDFRDRKLTDLIMAQVVRAVLKTPAGEMELQKAGDHWDIAKPLHTRADDQKVGDLIAQVTTARIQQFVADDKGDLHPYGLAEPRGSITLFTQDDKPGAPGQTLQVGSAPEKEKDQVYVRFSSRGFVYTLPKKIEEMLNTKPDDLRDRHLVRVDTKILDRVTIDAPGRGKTVLARKDDNWKIASRNNAPANSTEARRLIETMQNEQVSKFVEDVASNLPKYGLDKPQLTVTFSSFASENTAETKAGEEPFASVSFGKVDGENVYARVGDEPFVVTVRRALLDQIWTDPLQWQDLAIFNFKPEQIHRLTIKTDKDFELGRGANNQWSWAKGSGSVNEANLRALLNALSTLHATRWVGATLPGHGFDKPQLVVTFTSSPDDKATHKLTIGGTAPNGNWFAKVDERDGTFAISGADLNALKLPLAGQEPSAPSPTVTPTATPKPK
ncbi:MAG TPA: DUF4340 domain-containing protein [Chthoniobacterales bacterium]|nr:DUF4340 domain-containing protein [Chthoniobacterales bacterium]